MARSIQNAVRIAHHSGLSFRLTEINSVTCGGTPGVSDTFATALWAPDALFELLRARVDGVNVHVRPRTINAAFSISSGGLTANPMLYGLILFARTLGADSHLVQLAVHTRPSLHLKAWAVRVDGDVLHVLLINKGRESTAVALHLPVTGRATVQRLLAPSATSRRGVTLDAQSLTTTGRWQGRRTTQTITPNAGTYTLTVPRLSAALVSMHLRPGSLTLRHRNRSSSSPGASQTGETLPTGARRSPGSRTPRD
jgi:Glycosyl hydrolase family 79 C-terminal beta domain